MKKRYSLPDYARIHWALILAAMVALLIVACGSAAAPTEQQPAAAPADTTVSQPTAVAQPAPAEEPAVSTSAKDSITIVMSAEPGSVNPWDPNCNATLDNRRLQRNRQRTLYLDYQRRFRVGSPVRRRKLGAGG